METITVSTNRERLDAAISLVHVRALAASGRARELREAARLSQADVGAACGTTAAAVSRWEAGQRVPRRCAAAYAALIARLEALEADRV